MMADMTDPLAHRHGGVFAQEPPVAHQTDNLTLVDHIHSRSVPTCRPATRWTASRRGDVDRGGPRSLGARTDYPVTASPEAPAASGGMSIPPSSSTSRRSLGMGGGGNSERALPVSPMGTVPA